MKTSESNRKGWEGRKEGDREGDREGVRNVREEGEGKGKRNLMFEKRRIEVFFETLGERSVGHSPGN